MTTATPAPPKAPKPGDHRSERFIAYVIELCETKKSRADLRTGLGLPVERCNYLHRYLVSWTSPSMHPDTKRAFYSVASLIAARPRSARERSTSAAGEPVPLPKWYQRENLGASLARAVEADVMKAGSAEADLHLMARQSSETIHPRLPALTRHLLTGGVDIDWVVLLEDLAGWNRHRDRIATRWLESYFRLINAEDEAGNNTDGETPEGEDSAPPPGSEAL